MKRNPQGGYQADEPGGYQREADATFGLGMVRPCPEHHFALKGDPSNSLYTPAFRKDNADGTGRCVDCSAVLEARLR